MTLQVLGVFLAGILLGPVWGGTMVLAVSPGTHPSGLRFGRRDLPALASAVWLSAATLHGAV